MSRHTQWLGRGLGGWGSTVCAAQGDHRNAGRSSARCGRCFENRWALVPAPLPDPEAERPQRGSRSRLDAREEGAQTPPSLPGVPPPPRPPSRATGPLKRPTAASGMVSVNVKSYRSQRRRGLRGADATPLLRPGALEPGAHGGLLFLASRHFLKHRCRSWVFFHLPSPFHTVIYSASSFKEEQMSATEHPDVLRTKGAQKLGLREMRQS